MFTSPWGKLLLLFHRCVAQRCSPFFDAAISRRQGKKREQAKALSCPMSPEFPASVTAGLRVVHILLCFAHARKRLAKLNAKAQRKPKVTLLEVYHLRPEWEVFS